MYMYILLALFLFGIVSAFRAQEYSATLRKKVAPGTTALITGSSSGMGKQFADLYAKTGHDVILVARTESKLKEIAADLEERWNIKAHVIACDLSAPGAAAQLKKKVDEKNLTVHKLVNNAGYGANVRFLSMGDKESAEMINLNATALTEMMHEFIPDMVSRGEGRVLNVASLGGLIPAPNQAVYFASKAYVVSLSEAVAYELAPKGVKVTCLCPGAMHTEFGSRSGHSDTLLFRMPGFVMESINAVRAGFVASETGEFMVLPSWGELIAYLVMGHSPRYVRNFIMDRLTIPKEKTH
eukprot:Clim_evm20s11 gene=Clim_evmTU20s11